jgi:CRISPR/Cas system CSM-associated protein Csm3 (group 7 of RAMP superfamily)
VETLPAGTRWGFHLEIDTFRGDEEAETIALLALNEWVLGHGWLGRSPARGMGWVRLEINRLVRLPRNREILEVWPDNRVAPEVAIDRALKLANGAQEWRWDDAVTAAHQLADGLTLKDPAWQRGDWHYATFQAAIQPGPRSATVDDKDARYGYDVLQVSGHPAEKLVDSNADRLDRPVSVGKADDWRGDEFKQPDAPFVTTIPQGMDGPQPFVPGSGLRGPLRHTASRLGRSAGHSVIDPNDTQDATAEHVRQKLKEECAPDNARVDDAVRPVLEKIDQLAGVFGLEELSSRLLVSDANLANNGDDGFRIARVEHHSEDEFAGGVFAEGKFDSNVLLRGQLAFSLVVEGPDLSALKREVNKLLPALSMAELGHVPIGAGKWRGAGWLPWQFGEIRVRRAGQLDGTIASTPPDDVRPIAAKIRSVFADGAQTTEEDAQ